MHPIAVYPDQYPLAVHRPGHVLTVRVPGQPPRREAHTYDWTADRGSAHNSAGVMPVGVPTPLRAALSTRYETRAMLAMYLLCVDGRPLPSQPRVAKDAVPWLLEAGYELRLPWLIAEVDNPQHGDWTPELAEEFARLRAETRILDTAVVYTSRGGYRIVQPLAEPNTDPARHEDMLHGWMLALARAGCAVDPQAATWVTFQAAPRVPSTRGNRRVGETFDYDAAAEHLRALAPDEVPALPAQRAGARRGMRARARAAATPVDAPAFAPELPALWRPRARTVADAVAAVETVWHPLFLALGGALCDRGVPPELVPALVGAVSELTGRDDKTDDRVRSAQGTVGKWLAARADATAPPVRGYDALLVEWPAVAAAVDEATDATRWDRFAALCRRPAPALPPVDEAAAAMAAHVATPAAGPRVVVAQCGVGKTDGVLAVAAARAARRAANPDATGERAPPHSKTAVSAPRNDLAIQTARSAAERHGTPALRVFSPLSLRTPDGKGWECRFRDAGVAIARGGQSVRREFCVGRGGPATRCEFSGACRAEPGAEGPEGARLTIGNHALLGPLDAAAGPTGLLVIDEPPATIEAADFTPEDFGLLDAHAHAFERRYLDALRPLLYVLRNALGAASSADARAAPLRRVVRDRAHEVPAPLLGAARRAARIAASPDGDDAADIVACAAAAVDEDAPTPAPPIHPGVAREMRAPGASALARAVGAASRLLRAAQHAAVVADEASARAAARKDLPSRLHLAFPRAAFVRAMRRDGAVVVLDATPDIPALSRAAGIDLEGAGRVARFAARDGAPVERTACFWPDGVRKRLYTKTGVDAPVAARALRFAVRWALEDPEARSLCLVTFRRVALAIEHVRRPDDAEPVLGWTAALPREGLDELAQAIAPALGEWLADGRELIAMHYGATRGMNHAEHVDAIATVGDPWPDLAATREESAHLGLPNWEERYQTLCAAELEQAHGRIRAPRRTKKARALCMGAVLPSDPLWTGGITARRLPAHRPRADAAMSCAELAAVLSAASLSVRAAAKRLGCDPANLRKLLQGQRPVTPEFAARVREAIPEGAGPIGQGYRTVKQNIFLYNTSVPRGPIDTSQNAPAYDWTIEGREGSADGGWPWVEDYESQ